MSGLKAEIEGASIVLVGQFNPAIFQPAWLAAQKLIRQEEAEAATIEIIHPSVVRFATEWFTLEVSQGRFAVESTNPACAESLRDLVSGIFTILEHTPFSQAGVNSSMHFALSSADRWHALGHILAPKEPWAGVLGAGGLRSLTLAGKRDEAASKIHVTVEPSLRVLPHGVYINVNEEFECRPGPEAPRQLMASLLGEWSAARAYATRVAEHLLGQVEGK